MHVLAHHISSLPAFFPSGIQDALARALQRADEQSTDATDHWVPQMDIREEADRFVIRADLPGVAPEHIEVLMEGDTLSIKGERVVERKNDDTQDGVRFSSIERQTGRFHRQFVLPDTVETGRMTAIGHNGVLEVTLPKRPQATPKRIQVEVQRSTPEA